MNARSFVRNFGSLLTGRAGGDFFIFLLIITIARTFGPEGNGSYGVAMSIAGFFVAFADFGLRELTIKQISGASDEPGFLNRVVGLRLWLTLGSALVLFALAPWVDFGPDAELVLLAIVLQQVLRCLAEGVSAVFVAKERAFVPGLLELLCKMIAAGGAIGLILAGQPLGLSLMMLPAAELLNTVAACVWVYQHVGSLRPVLRPSALESTVRQTTPYALSGILQQFASRIDVLFVGLILGAAAAGLYHSAFRIVVVLLTIPYFASYAALPILSRVYASDPAHARRLYDQMVGGILLVGLPAVVGLMWFATPTIRLVFGEAFDGADDLLQLLAPLVLLVWLSETLGIMLLATDRVVLRTWHKGWAAGLNITGNVVLLYSIGVAGAAYSSLAGECLLILLHAASLAPVVGWPRCLDRLGIASLGCLGYVGLIMLLPPLPLFVSIGIAILAYTAIVLAFPTIRRREVRLLSELARKRSAASG